MLHHAQFIVRHIFHMSTNYIQVTQNCSHELSCQLCGFCEEKNCPRQKSHIGSCQFSDISLPNTARVSKPLDIS